MRYAKLELADKWLTTHITLKLDVDFEGKKLGGNVALKLKSLTESESKEIKLDSR
jgi:hypothetical protein